VKKKALAGNCKREVVEGAPGTMQFNHGLPSAAEPQPKGNRKGL
jgi:hypothetical protein